MSRYLALLKIFVKSLVLSIAGEIQMSVIHTENNLAISEKNL